MDGVIVHTQHVLRGTPILIAIVFLLIVVLSLVALVWVAVKSFKNKHKNRWFAMFVALAWTVCAFFLSALAINDALTIHTNLIVTIEDTVGFNEFNERYEIISKDGNLYTVRELPIEETEPEEAGDNE